MGLPFPSLVVRWIGRLMPSTHAKGNGRAGWLERSGLGCKCLVGLGLGCENGEGATAVQIGRPGENLSEMRGIVQNEAGVGG